MKRTKYYINPSDKNNWEVKKGGNERATKVFENKDDAIGYGKGLAKGQSPSQLIIRKKTGEIQEERTYGSDPFPPKG